MGKDNMNNKAKFKRPESMTSKSKMRMGGKGLSLEAFANAKSKTDYNPAIIKKKREFYKNAKYVSKYKKLKKHENYQTGPSFPDIRLPKDEDESVGNIEIDREKRKKKKKDSGQSLNEIYEKKRAEQEKARIEKEAIIKAKKERIEQSQSQRKTLRGKMLKRTRSGQPVMKYRIEQMLEKLQGSKS